jgi:hypothetical protein
MASVDVSEWHSDWAWHHRDSIHHECGHAITAYVLGGEVREVAFGPATVAEFGSLLNGYVDHDRSKLTPFNKLVVALSGEVSAAMYAHRKPDFTTENLQGDMANATELVREYYGCKVRDVIDTEYFRRAVRKSESILGQWSWPLACLVLKLQRPPYKLDSAQFLRTMENCRVKQL